MFSRSVLDQPEIAHYANDFGLRRGDVGVVAETPEGTPIGAAWLRLFSGDDPGFGSVDDKPPELSVAVVPAHGGSGVGTDLLSRLLEQVPRASISVDERNPPIRLYERFGFEEVERNGFSVTMLRVSVKSADEPTEPGS